MRKTRALAIRRDLRAEDGADQSKAKTFKKRYRKAKRSHVRRP